MNEVLNTIAKRYSCRAFDGRPVAREQLDAIALAAVQAPSAMNRQPWQLAVITDKAFIEEMDAAAMAGLAAAEDQGPYQRFMQRGGKLFYNAPCMFLILQQEGGELDVGIVAQNIALAASSLGLGNVICGMAAIPFSTPGGEAFRQRTGFGNGWGFGMAVLVGHAIGSGTPHEADMGKIRFVE